LVILLGGCVVACAFGAAYAVRGWNVLASVRPRDPSVLDRASGFLMYMLFAAGFLALMRRLVRGLKE
jgi:hypothetical protein